MPTHKSNQTANRVYEGRHRFEHWYRDNQVYFITARCSNRFPAFATDAAKAIFWSRFEHYTATNTFTPWVTSLLDNHYHTLGYLKQGDRLAPMLKGIHGSVAKLVNDLLESNKKAGRLQSACSQLQSPYLTNGRLLPFWGEHRQSYFDGCIRDETQAQRTYRYITTQSKRHGICPDWRNYPHTHINIELPRALKRATQLNAFLRNVPYKRYIGRGT